MASCDEAEDTTALPGAATSGFTRPSAVGPWLENEAMPPMVSPVPTWPTFSVSNSLRVT